MCKYGYKYNIDTIECEWVDPEDAIAERAAKMPVPNERGTWQNKPRPNTSSLAIEDESSKAMLQHIQEIRKRRNLIAKEAESLGVGYSVGRPVLGRIFNVGMVTALMTAAVTATIGGLKLMRRQAGGPIVNGDDEYLRLYADG
jgi:hypothetical protein